MTQEGQLSPPPVLWAQRRDILFITICLEDCKDPVLKIEPEILHFKGTGGTENKMHEITINLYKEINPDKTLKNLGGRTLELVLVKKEEGPYWPRLTKDKTKAHWLKSDFNKWKDEDDSEEEGDLEGGGSPDLEEMMRQMGGLGGSGVSKPNFDDLGDEMDEIDSDDEEIPDLE
ncbi:hypothetical protein M0802_002144 [Mischocyttarus mexicanus]|nr:hypothetical protein M0802_002144 [Mischocyttarus mexicanus]